MVDVLSVAVLVGSGLTAGVLFCVAFSIVPAFGALPAGRYVQTHRLIGRHYDRVMPLTVLGSAAADLALAALDTGAASRPLFGAAAALLLGVSAVSHLANVPINRRVKSLDPSAIPAVWDDPRPVWRNWNLVRTALAVLALTGNACAVVL